MGGIKLKKTKPKLGGIDDECIQYKSPKPAKVEHEKISSVTSICFWTKHMTNPKNSTTIKLNIRIMVLPFTLI